MRTTLLNRQPMAKNAFALAGYLEIDRRRSHDEAAASDRRQHRYDGSHGFKSSLSRMRLPNVL
jgi:hypothetical protein